MKDNNKLSVLDRYAEDGILNVSDSMQLDSGSEVCSLTAESDGRVYGIDVITHGEVRVRYKGDIYRHASQMPEDLLGYLGGKRDTVKDSDVDVIENNWFEQVISEVNGDGSPVRELSSDVTDIDFTAFKDTEELFAYLESTLAEHIKAGD